MTRTDRLIANALGSSNTILLGEAAARRVLQRMGGKDLFDHEDRPFCNEALGVVLQRNFSLYRAPWELRRFP